jgi:List-Bact-rpt repeat protein
MSRICVLVLSLTVAACFAAGDAIAAQLTASWTDNSGGEATTRLERRPQNVVAFAAIADVPAGVTAYVDTSVSAGTTYCYRAVAYDDVGASPYSDEACATTSGNDGTSLDLAVSKFGVGAGTIASAPAGILCGSDCTASYPAGTPVTLSATPAAGSTFTGWNGGGCAGTGPCTIAGNARVAVAATFTAATKSIAVSKAGDVTGSIVSSPAGIQCGTTCFATYSAGTQVTLTANPAAGSTFAGWSGGGCSGTGACTVNGSGLTSVTATFTSTANSGAETGARVAME